MTVAAQKVEDLLMLAREDALATRNAPTLEDAITLAVSAHRGQGYPTRKLRREPFIVHPLRVMVRMRTGLERTVAVLHDLIEDTHYTLNDLRDLGYSPEVVNTIDSLTHRTGESYEAYIRRVGANPLARRVKLADLEDNLANNQDVDSRADEDARMSRYRDARDLLSSE